MGFLNNIFGKEKKDYPVLDGSNPVADRLKPFQGELENFAKEVTDPIEVIPTGNTAYLYLGTPPKRFGIAWIRDGKVFNFKTLAEQKGISEMKLQLMSEKLREAYEKSTKADRFIMPLSNQRVIVTSSESFERELERIIEH